MLAVQAGQFASSAATERKEYAMKIAEQKRSHNADLS